MVWSVAWLKKLEEDSLKENFNDVFEVLSEVCEEAEEYGHYQRKDLPLVRHTVSE